MSLLSLLFSAPQLKNKLCLIALVRHIVLYFVVYCFCVYATDALRGKNGESGLSEQKKHRKTTESRNRLEEYPFDFFSSGTAGALLVQENTRVAAGQAGAAAPWPLNVLPNKTQTTSSLGHRGETARGLC